MQTFDQALYLLFEDGVISYEEAIRNADSQNELRLRIKLESRREALSAKAEGESLTLEKEEKEALF
jgi:twitching motility protein PilU